MTESWQRPRDTKGHFASDPNKPPKRARSKSNAAPSRETSTQSSEMDIDPVIQRKAEIIRQNLKQIPYYFGGPREGDNHTILEILAREEREDGVIVSAATMMSGDVLVGHLIKTGEGLRLSKSRPAPDNLLVALSSQARTLRKYYRDDIKVNRPHFPPYNPPETHPSAKPKNSKK